MKKEITQKDFLSQLTKLTESFQKEKDSIDKSKEGSEVKYFFPNKYTTLRDT